MPQAYGDYQHEIYFNALQGVPPELPMAFAELEERARATLAPSIWSYVAGGAGDEATQRANVEAFARWGLIPRMLVGAKQRARSVCSDSAPRTATATWPRREPRHSWACR